MNQKQIFGATLSVISCLVLAGMTFDGVENEFPSWIFVDDGALCQHEHCHKIIFLENEDKKG